MGKAVFSNKYLAEMLAIGLLVSMTTDGHATVVISLAPIAQVEA